MREKIKKGEICLMAPRYNYNTFMYLCVYVLAVYCVHEPIELCMFCHRKGTNQRSAENNAKCSQIRAILSWQDIFLFPCIELSLGHYTAKTHCTYKRRPSTAGLFLCLEESCVYVCLHILFVGMHFKGEHCNTCELSVLNPRCYVKEQQCLRSPICFKCNAF